MRAGGWARSESPLPASPSNFRERLSGGQAPAVQKKLSRNWMGAEVLGSRCHSREDRQQLEFKTSDGSGWKGASQNLTGWGLTRYTIREATPGVLPFLRL